MTTYLILIRGINVGGKNKIPMAELRLRLEEAGFADVTTYIQSGNVILSSNLGAAAVKEAVQVLLPTAFTLDLPAIKVLVLTREQLQAVADNKPAGFGEQPDKYYSDVIFLMDVSLEEAMAACDPREGVDRVWPGAGVIYWERLSAQRTKSRLNKAMSAPAYKSETIRSWSTMLKLLELLQ